MQKKLRVLCIEMTGQQQKVNHAKTIHKLISNDSAGPAIEK